MRKSAEQRRRVVRREEELIDLNIANGLTLSTGLIEVNAVEVYPFEVEGARAWGTGESRKTVGRSLGVTPGIITTRIEGVAPPIVSSAVGERGLEGVAGLGTTRVSSTSLSVLTSPASLT